MEITVAHVSGPLLLAFMRGKASRGTLNRGSRTSARIIGQSRPGNTGGNRRKSAPVRTFGPEDFRPTPPCTYVRTNTRLTWRVGRGGSERLASAPRMGIGMRSDAARRNVKWLVRWRVPRTSLSGPSLPSACRRWRGAGRWSHALRFCPFPTACTHATAQHN